MSQHGRDTAVAMDRSEQNSGSWRNLAVRRVTLTSLLAGILLLGIASVVVNVARAEPPPGNWALTFNEEFSANGLNTALWTPEWPGGPMSGECTSPSLVSQPGNGYLYLQVRAQESTCGGTKHPDTGALVEANPADGKPGHTGFLYSYGYVEWHVYIVGWGGEAQGCPKGGCIPDWPALWSFPENQENEIDTMEGLRREACHTWWHHVSPVEETQGCQTGISYAGWHTYGADWEPGVLKFYYDGAQVGEVKSGYINSTPQYLIMDDVPPNGHGDQLVVPDEIVVDYARVWQHPVPPSATTTAATAVQFRRSALNGTVNPNGFDTHDYFQYGTSTSYGSTTGEVDAGSGTSAVGASATITGLEPNTTYHYRVVATNAGGTSYGSDSVFTTAAPPGLSISNRLQSSMTLSWTASTNASSYTIKRNGGTIGSTTSLTYVDTKLQPTTFYYYEVVANDENESAGSSVVTRATTPLSTVKADVNGDGKTDLVYIYPGGYIDTFFSKGNGTYEEVVEHLKEFESTPGLWLSGDFNGDGKADLVYIYPNGYIDTFLSKGNGTYEEKSELIEAGFNTTGGTWEVGDFNGDGKSDLAYILPGGYIDTFFSKGNGTYEEVIEHLKEFDSTSGKWFTGDFNGDGKADLLYIYPGGYIDTFLSKGNGTYEEKSELIEAGFNSSSGQWFAGDYNGDGKADLIYVYPGTNSYIDTFLSKGDGTYEKKSEELKAFDSTSGSWMTGDFNGDGKVDLAYAYPGGYLDTFLSKGNGTYEEKTEHLTEFDSSSGRWRTGDSNGDGKTDLLYTYPGGYLDTFVSKGNGTYEEKTELVKEFDDTTGLWL